MLTIDVAAAAREKTFAYEDKALARHRDLFLLRLRRDRGAALEGSVRPSAPNVDPERVRAIVEPEAQKLGNKAVLFQAEGSSALRVKELIPFQEATSQTRGTKLLGFLVNFSGAGCSITD